LQGARLDRAFVDTPFNSDNFKFGRHHACVQEVTCRDSWRLHRLPSGAVAARQRACPLYRRDQQGISVRTESCESNKNCRASPQLTAKTARQRNFHPSRVRGVGRKRNTEKPIPDSRRVPETPLQRSIQEGARKFVDQFKALGPAQHLQHKTKNNISRDATGKDPAPALDPLPLPVHGHQEHRSPVAFRPIVSPAAFAAALAAGAAGRTNACLRRRPRNAGTARTPEVKSERPEGGEVCWPNLVEGHHVLQEKAPGWYLGASELDKHSKIELRFAISLHDHTLSTKHGYEGDLLS